ncbi:glycosyl transferase, family 2 [Zunongwangia profunda SM-A87]|uniref:Glycosyl transferase, family 2 n=1 Tax=Zunongwangia profunda (strain DSM 18752 / CCTCC AB 206139 / SM-A87) TaxID=655815 RepID=D5BIJ0_ZUNPS|nr:glycosyltransferase family 2 protein [Zunongwangia profunda]ADF51442.1 glycosyl transferase, family 2 [Zunongwangia profunda SM-A87]
MIVIVTYNGLKWIDKCLQSCGDFPVVVVDNNSLDGTIDFIKLNYPKVHLIEQDKNLGFGQANNIGISYALNQEAHYVFLLNQDAYLTDNCLNRLIKIQQNNTEYGILSPFHYKGSFTGLDDNFVMYMSRYKVSRDYIFDANEGNIKEVYSIPFVNAAGWLIPKRTLESVGYFDSLFFHYGEDRNYCQRVLYHNMKIGIVPEAKMIHDREFREVKPVLKYSEEYYDEYLRYAKIKWADINLKGFDDGFYEHLKKLQLDYFKHLFKLKFKDGKDSFKKYKILKSLYLSFKESRERNSNKFQ